MDPVCISINSIRIIKNSMITNYKLEMLYYLLLTKSVDYTPHLRLILNYKMKETVSEWLLYNVNSVILLSYIMVGTS